MNIGIDGSRCRSGGAIAHLKGILSNLNPDNFGFDEVHIWANEYLAKNLPKRRWLNVHTPKQLKKSLIRQLVWQFFSLEGAAKKKGCQILFSADASTLSSFRPIVVMNQDVLPFEKSLLKNSNGLVAFFRNCILHLLQVSSIKKADGVIFNTKYAQELLQKRTGVLPNSIVIPLAVDDDFFSLRGKEQRSLNLDDNISCVYVANALPYKHIPNVMLAINMLRTKYRNITLDVIGGGSGPEKEKLIQLKNEICFDSRFIRLHDFLPKNEVKKRLVTADLFVFASTCESFGVTLLEGMAMGLPIACLKASSLPETLGNSGLYFDNLDPRAISEVIEMLIIDKHLRQTLSVNAKKTASTYSWKLTAQKTFQFISDTLTR